MKLSQIILEFLGAKEYKAPGDAQTMMADFYMVQMLQQPDVHYPSHLRDEQEYELKQVEKTLLPQLKKHLLSAVGLSICSELRHFFDWTAFVGDPAQRSLHDDDRQLQLKLQIARQLLSTDLILRLRMEPYPEDHEFAYTPDLSNGYALAVAGLQLFSDQAAGEPIAWDKQYGGPAWLEACKSWLKLYGTTSSTDITLAVDHIYDLQHNTGQLLDKNQEYQDDWVTELLDLKYAYKNPEPLLSYASPLLRELAQSYMRYFERHQDTADQLGPLRELLAQLELQIRPFVDKPGSSLLIYHNPRYGDEDATLCSLTLLPHGLIKLVPYLAKLQNNGFKPTQADRFAITDLPEIRKYLTTIRQESLVWYGRKSGGDDL